MLRVCNHLGSFKQLMGKSTLPADPLCGDSEQPVQRRLQSLHARRQDRVTQRSVQITR